MLEYRILAPNEWDQVRASFARRDWRVPNPRLSLAAVAEDDGRLAAGVILQPVLHLEPVFSEPGYEARADFRRIFRLVKSQFAGQHLRCLALATDKIGAGMARAAGMEPMAGEIWRLQ